MQDILQKIGVNVNVAFYLIFLSLIWVRVLAMTSVVPFLFGKPVPRYVAIGASMVLALFIYPCIVPRSPPPMPEEIPVLVVLYVKEVFFGFAIGFIVSIIFYAMESVGQMIDNQRGVSIARLLIPQLGEQGSISGAFLFQLGIVLYFAFGGHLAFFDAFYRSFIVLPVLDFPVTGPGLFPMVDLFIKVTGQVLYIALQMAAPVIIAIFMADLILGIANRVAPQINVWELGFHIKGYVGILLLFVSITMIGEQINHYTTQSNTYADQMVEYLQGKTPPQAPEEENPPEALPPTPQVQTISP